LERGGLIGAFLRAIGQELWIRARLGKGYLENWPFQVFDLFSNRSSPIRMGLKQDNLRFAYSSWKMKHF